MPYSPPEGAFLFSMSWRIVNIEQSHKLSLYLDNLKVEINDESIVIPLSDVDVLLIDNAYTLLGTQLLTKCIEYKILVIICDTSHLLKALLLDLYSNHFKSFDIQLKQQEWDKFSKEYLWQQIVKTKIINQAKILRKNTNELDTVNRMFELADEVELGDSTNREGIAAKMYFRALFGSNFMRFNDDPINHALNYGYTIIRAAIARTIVAKGLNPLFGIHHIGVYNNFNLADDIIEPFRPIVDNYAYQNMVGEDAFTRNNRLELLELLQSYIKIDGKYQTVSNAIDIYVSSIIKYFETGDIEVVKHPESITKKKNE